MNTSRLNHDSFRHKTMSYIKVILNNTRTSRGFTLLEIIIVLSIISILSTIGSIMYVGHLERARVYSAIQILTAMSTELQDYGIDSGSYPQSLNDLGYGNLLDPWGTPYQYLNISTANRGQMRKDRFLVPINSDFDLYSMGKDGDSRRPLVAPVSRDDVIRANDGQYIGIAEGF